MRFSRSSRSASVRDSGGADAQARGQLAHEGCANDQSSAATPSGASAKEGMRTSASEAVDRASERLPVRRRRHMAPRKAEGPAHRFWWQAHREEHVARIVAAGRTGGAVRDGHDVLEGEHHGLGVKARQRDIEYMRQRLVRGAIHLSFERRQLLKQALAEQKVRLVACRMLLKREL